MSEDAEYYDEQVSVFYKEVGNDYFEKRDYPKALEWYQKALAIDEKVLGTEHPDTAITYNNIALVYSTQGDYPKALEWNQRALAIREKVLGAEHPDTATTYNNIALVYYSQGDYPKALDWNQRALAIREKVLGTEHPKTARTYNNIALAYYYQGDYPKALEWYQKDLAICERVLGTEHPDTATTYNNIALVYSTQGDYSKALEWNQKALGINEKVLGAEHPDTATTYNNIAGVYHRQGDYAKALEWYQKDLAICEKVLGTKHPDTATTYNNIALVYYSQGDYPKALEWYQMALGIVGEVLGEEHSYYTGLLGNLYGLYLTMDDYTQALAIKKEASQQNISRVNRFFTFLSEQGRENYWNTLSFSFEESYSLSWFHPGMGSNILNYDNALFTKGLLLRTANAVRDSIYFLDNQELITKYEELQGLRQQIGNLQQRGSGDEVYIKNLEDDAEEREKYLVRESSAFRDFKDSLSIDWQDVRKSLLPGEAAIEFVSFRLFDRKLTGDTQYAALVLRPRFDAPQWVPLPDCGEAIQEFLKEKDFDKKDGHALYATIWQPLESVLKEVKTVYYSPSGLLYKISFNAIPTTEGLPLMDAYDLNLVSSTREVISRKNRTANKPDSGVVYGGLQYDVDENGMKKVTQDDNTPDTEVSENAGLPDGNLRRGYRPYWDKLFWSDKEGEDIEKILSKNSIHTDLYRDTKGAIKGTKESFKNLNGKKKSVLHLATHGFFFGDIEKNNEERERLERLGGGKKVFENPLLRSGLVLAGANHAWIGEPIAGVENGILFADDVARMNLVGAQLVVLSACDTALGEVNNSEGVFGLQRAFKLAGAETLIMSLWEVDDKSTCELMTSFYEKWLSEKKSKQQAFKEAQRELRKKYPAPFYWAAFVMID